MGVLVSRVTPPLITAVMPATTDRRHTAPIALVASPTPLRPALAPAVERLLADASEALAECTDLELVLRATVQLPVPLLADIVVVDLRTARELTRRMVTQHADPETGQELRASADQHVPPPGSPRSPVAAVFASGDTLMHTVFARGDDDGAPNGALSTIIVALREGATVLGAISMLARHDDREFGPADRIAAEAYARRVSRAILHARRSENERDGRMRAEAQIEVLRHTADVLASCAEELRRELDEARRSEGTSAS